MKVRTNLFFWGIILSVSTIFAVVEEYVWKPAQMPRTARIAAEMEKQAAKEDEIIRKKLSTERDPQERARLEQDREKIEYDIETYESAKINLDIVEKAAADRAYAREHQEMVKNAQETIAQREQEIKAKITSYEQAISRGGKVVEGGGGQETHPYQTALDGKLASLPQEDAQVRFLRQELYMLDSGKSTLVPGQDLTNYARRKEVLEVMREKVRQEIAADKQKFKDIRDRIEEYLQEIENFERSPHVPLTGNKLDAQLKLAYKIPRDQVRELKKVLLESSFDKNFPQTTQKYQAAIEAAQALDAYKIYNDYLQKRIHDIVTEPSVTTVRMKQEKIEEQQLRILDETLAAALKEPDYAKQKEKLQEVLARDINPYALRESFRMVKERAQERIAQIDAFLKSPRKMPLSKNALDRELNLSQKLPADQMQAVMDYIELFGYLEDPETLNKSNVEKLRQARDAMTYYGLDKEFPVQTGVIDAAISKATPKQAELPPDIPKTELTGNTPLAAVVETVMDTAKTPEVLKKSLMSKFFSGGKLVITTVAKFVARTAGALHEAVRYGVNATGKQIQHTFTAPETITKMANMPKTFEDIVNTLVEFDKKGGGVYAGIAKADINAHIKLYELLTGDKETADQLRAFVEGGYKDTLVGKEGAAGAPTIAKVRTLVNTIGTTGAILKSIIEMPKWFGDQLEALSRSQEDHYVMKRFDEAKQYIEDERQRMKIRKKAESEKLPFEQTVRDGVASWAKRVTELFGTMDHDMKIAQDSYTQARKEYLTLLGLPERATESQIATALRRKESLIYDDIVKATQKMADATAELAQVYQRYVAQLESAQINLEFLVKAWDAIRVTPEAKNVQFIEFVRGTFALREARLSYLQNILDEVKKLEQALPGVSTNEVGQLRSDYNQAIIKIINEKIFGTLVDYGKAIADMSAIIDEHKTALESKMPKLD